MRKVGNFWLPDSDSYFGKFFKDGSDGFQLDRLKGALTFVGEFGVAIDGGAHVGSWSRYMSSLFEQVVSFEPAPDTYECLDKNVGSIGNISLHNKALGGRSGKVMMLDDVTRPGNTGSRFVEVRSSGTIDMTTIDELNLSRLDFLKLDLEGAEILALRGAERTLRRSKPVVYIEAKKGMAGRFGADDSSSLHFMKEIGATQVAKFGSDYVFVFRG